MTDRHVFVVERIAECLIERGNMSTQDLVKALGETRLRISNALKGERQFARWGIYRAGYVTAAHGSGNHPVLWGIDEAKYREYRKQRKDMPWLTKRLQDPNKPKVVAKSKPRVKIPKERIVPLADRKVYTGPILTRWQPSSPYYTENP